MQSKEYLLECIAYIESTCIDEEVIRSGVHVHVDSCHNRPIRMFERDNIPFELI